MNVSRGLGLALGFWADRRWGDPARRHPVAGFGMLATRLERAAYADSRVRGTAYCLALVGGCAGLGVVVERVTRAHPLAHTVVTALATWTVLGGRSLEREALAVHDLLERDDLPAARRRLTHLVGRDTSSLSADEVARAVVESVAENASDAVTTPLWWGAVAGIPGLVGHRAANTLDAMIGHRSPRYLRFGWASARLDDVLGLPGARYGGLAVLLASPSTAGVAWRTWRRDARRHPSPNAGVVEAAFAGALGVRLGGTNRYGTRTEERAVLGDGVPVRPDHVPAATDLARRVGLVAMAGAAAVAVRREGHRPSHPAGLHPRAARSA